MYQLEGVVVLPEVSRPLNYDPGCYLNVFGLPQSRRCSPQARRGILFYSFLPVARYILEIAGSEFVSWALMISIERNYLHRAATDLPGEASGKSRKVTV